MEIKKKKALSDHWWFWLIPMAILLVVIYLYPISNILRMSFTDTRIGSMNFNYTFDSYKYVFSDPELWNTIKITLIFALGSVVFQLGLGLCCALLINKDLPGAGLVKLSMIIAWVVPGVITGIIWSILCASSAYGVFNNIIEALGFERLPLLSEPKLALLCALVANIWRGIGFSGIMQYAALRAIPTELFESARLDGANEWIIFRKITLPQLKPMFLINLVLITIFSINTYDSIYSLTQGGPGNATAVLPLQAYRAVFTYQSLGRGSVYAVLLLAISVGLTVIYLKLMGREEK